MHKGKKTTKKLIGSVSLFTVQSLDKHFYLFRAACFVKARLKTATISHGKLRLDITGFKHFPLRPRHVCLFFSQAPCRVQRCRNDIITQMIQYHRICQLRGKECKKRKRKKGLKHGRESVDCSVLSYISIVTSNRQRRK